MFSKILVAIDIHENYDKIMKYTKEIAEKNNSEIYLITVLPNFYGIIDQYILHDTEKIKNRMLDEAKERLKYITNEKLGSDFQVKKIVAVGQIYDAIVEVAEQNKLNAIIIQASKNVSNDDSKNENYLGPNAARVARNAGMSVLIVR
jgi:nucleotide-binding universal stress UspA family protein